MIKFWLLLCVLSMGRSPPNDDRMRDGIMPPLLYLCLLLLLLMEKGEVKSPSPLACADDKWRSTPLLPIPTPTDGTE